MTTVLRYTGDDEGVPFVMGVPARNLTDDDLAALVGGRHGKDRGAVRRNLVKSGMYAEVVTAKPTAKPNPSTEAASEPAAPEKADKE